MGEGVGVSCPLAPPFLKIFWFRFGCFTWKQQGTRITEADLPKRNISCYFTQSQNIDTGTTSPGITDPITAGI